MPLRPITDEFLISGQLFMLCWREGVTFHRVELAEPLHYAPWVLHNAGTVVDISPDSSQSELGFYDPRNTAHDLLYLESQIDIQVWGGTPWILHGSIGIRPKGRHLRMFIKYPKGGHHYGHFPETGAIQSDTAKNFFGLNGLLSPYEDPSNYIELWIPPRLEIGAEWYNDHPTDSITPVCNLMFRLYHFTNYNPASSNKDERELCQKMASGKVKVKVGQLGTTRHLLSFAYDEWKYADGERVNPIKRIDVERGEV